MGGEAEGEAEGEEGQGASLIGKSRKCSIVQFVQSCIDNLTVRL